jgi:hypothetical protein
MPIKLWIVFFLSAALCGTPTRTLAKRILSILEGSYIGGTSPTVQNNTITANTGCSGIGINIGSGAPLIQNNIISNNVQVGCSGGIGGGPLPIKT